MSKTEFTDKTGAPLYTGDIVQWRLGKYAMKSGGPQFYEVAISKKRGVGLKMPDNPVIRPLRASDSRFIVIFDKSKREL